MTDKTSSEIEPVGDDQAPYDFHYDHGRMPLFLKLLWICFIVLATTYIVRFLLAALAEDIGG